MSTSLFLAASLALAPVNPADPASVVTALQDNGYSAKLDKSDDGDPIILSSAAGANFHIFFYGCTNNRDCQTLQFASAWSLEKNDKPSLAKVNDFNREFRFARAYLDEDVDPWIEMDAQIADGPLSEAHFTEVLEVWSSLLGEFLNRVVDPD